MKSILHFLSSSSLLLLLACSAIAQTDIYNLQNLPLQDLSAFKSPGKNWSIAGEVTGNFNDSQLRTKSGQGILVNTLGDKDPKYQAGQNLFTSLEHGDMVMELDFILPKGSNSGIYLQGRYEIQLMDSWGIKIPKVQDCGSIYERWDDRKPEGQKGYEGHPARINASLAPGLWQHLWIEFQAPRFDATGKKTQAAKFVKVVLNGITINENVYLSGPTRAAAFIDEKPNGPLMIQGDHGSVAFRNIKYALLNDFNFKVSDVSYEYYEGEDFEQFDQVKASQLVRKGKADNIDNRLADARDQYYIQFAGKFEVEVADNYTFIMPMVGTGKLEVDGKTVIASGWGSIGANPLRGSINLSAGEHTFKLHCLKHASWKAPGLGLYVQKTNNKPKALHAGPSLPEPEPKPLIEVKALGEPVTLRSFLQYNGKKKTHCISVGDPSGVNFSYDLSQAGLLDMWKGPFLNATEMWYERGEPQTAEPMGASIVGADAAPLTIYSDVSQMFPDSLNDRTELIYKGYTLDAQRYPVFNYQYNGAQISDRFLPYENGKGLTRQVTVSNAPAGKQVAYRLAEGKNVVEVSKGLYSVQTENSGYYVQLSDTSLKPVIQDKKGGKALIIPYQPGKKAGSELRYTMLW
jgi:hypothetical protein